MNRNLASESAHEKIVNMYFGANISIITLIYTIMELHPMF